MPVGRIFLGMDIPDDIKDALIGARLMLHVYEEQMDGEFGCCRSVDQIRADGHLPKETLAVEAVIEKYGITERSPTDAE